MAVDPLLIALESWYDKSTTALPDEQRDRVESLFFAPEDWDRLSPDDRRRAAAELCELRNRGAEPSSDLKPDFLNFPERKEKIKRTIKKLESSPVRTDTGLRHKKARIAERQKTLALVEQQERRLGDGHRQSNSGSGQTSAAQHTIPYPEAFERLTTKLDGVTPEEMGAWVWLGPDAGGLAAYRYQTPDQVEPPRRVSCVEPKPPNFDYLAPVLRACHFIVEEINSFQPTDRFITGKALIGRWSNQPGIQPEAFIRAMIQESRLLDFYPMLGRTQGSLPNDESYPPLEMGLFFLIEVEAIEKAESIDVMALYKARTGNAEVQKWTPEKLADLRKVHNDLKRKRHKSPTKELAMRHGVSESRIRELLRKEMNQGQQ